MKFFHGRFSTRSRHGSDEQEQQGYGTLASNADIVIDFDDDDKKPDESTDSNDEDSSSSEESASFAGDSDDEEANVFATIKEHTQIVARRFEHRENRGVARSKSFDADQVGAQCLSVSGHSRTRANKKPMVHAKSFDEDIHKSKPLSSSNHSRGHARRVVRRMPRRSSVGPGTSCKDLIKDASANKGDNHKSLSSKPEGSSSEVRHKRRSLKDSLHKRRTDRKVAREPLKPEEKEKLKNELLISADLLAELELLADSDASEDEDEDEDNVFAETVKAELEAEEEALKMRRSSANSRAPARRRSIGYEENKGTEAPKVNANPSLVGHFKSTQTKSTDAEDASVGGHSRAAKSLPASDGRRARRRLSIGAGEPKMARNENMSLSLVDQTESLISEMYPDECPSPEEAAVVGRRTQRVPRRMSFGAGERRSNTTSGLGSHLESTAPNRDEEEASVGGYSRSAKTAPESGSRQVPASRQMRRRASLGGAVIREDEEQSGSRPSGKKEKRVSIAKGSGHSRRKSPTKRHTSEHKSSSEHKSTKPPAVLDDNSAHIYVEHRDEDHTSFLQFSIGPATAM